MFASFRKLYKNLHTKHPASFRKAAIGLETLEDRSLPTVTLVSLSQGNLSFDAKFATNETVGEMQSGYNFWNSFLAQLVEARAKGPQENARNLRG